MQTKLFAPGMILCFIVVSSGCSQTVDPGRSDGGKVVRVDLGTDHEDVTLNEISSSATVTLEQLALVAWPDADLSALGADLVGVDGFRPASKSTCRGLIPVPGDLLARGVLDIQTANLTWDEELGYSGCMQVRGLERLILVSADDAHVSVDVVLGQDSQRVDLRFQPTQEVDGSNAVALDGIVSASGMTQSEDLYLYDLESLEGIMPGQDLSAAPLDFSALKDGFVDVADGGLLWRSFPDDDDRWDLKTLSAIHLIEREGEPVSVQVVLGDQEVEVALGTLDTVAMGAERLVALHEVISASGLASTPEEYVFDFEGSDGFRPSLDKGLDPLDWEQLASGWIHPITASLTWSPEASIPSAWHVSNVAKVYMMVP